MDAELGAPQWIFGMAMYAFLADGRIAAIVTQNGTDRLVFVSPSGAVGETELPYTAYGRRIRSNGNSLVFIAASPTEAAAVIRLDAATGARDVLGRSLEQPPDPQYISRPRSISFPTEDGAVAYAIYYPPANADFVGPEGELPPLIVESHGGPTSMSLAQLNLDIQYWTSRGFGVADVNY